MPRNELQNIEYLLNDPRIRKWIKQCNICQSFGILYNAPEKYFGKYNIDKLGNITKINEDGICIDCLNRE